MRGPGCTHRQGVFPVQFHPVTPSKLALVGDHSGRFSCPNCGSPAAALAIQSKAGLFQVFRNRMPGYYKTEAIVLRSMRLREADRIVHLYTAHARPGRRGGEGRAAHEVALRRPARAVLPRAAGALRGPRRAHTVTQAEAIEWYPRLREHGASLCAAGAACESVLRLFGEGEAQRRPPTTCSATSSSCSTPTRRRPARRTCSRSG